MNQTQLGSLIASATSFHGCTDFAEALANGYVPTLRLERGTSKRVREHNEEIITLRAYLTDSGFSVFPEKL